MNGMTTDHKADGGGPARRHGAVVAREERVAWPPSASAVWIFVVALFCLGGPATWWAVTR